MLIVNDSDKPVTVKTKYRGQPITLDIRPFSREKADEFTVAHTTHEIHPHPTTGQLQRIEVLDNNAYFVDLMDYLLAGFSGVGSSRTDAWPVTRENKVKLVLIPPSEGDMPLSNFVMMKAKEFAFVAEKDEAAARKK